jgi:hypothetical protein
MEEKCQYDDKLRIISACVEYIDFRNMSCFRIYQASKQAIYEVIRYDM